MELDKLQETTKDSLEIQLIDWNGLTIGELERTSLLNGKDLEILKSCAPAAIRAFNTTQMFRTPTEMRMSVLNDVKFPTADSKYWQSVREMNGMVESLMTLSFTYKKKVLDLETLCIQLEKTSPSEDREDIIKWEYKQVEIKEKEYEITCIQREAHHRIREIEQWKNIQNSLETQVKCGVEECNNHQLFSYALRFLQELKIAEEGHADKSLESWRNLNALVQSSVSLITAMKLRQDLIDVVGQNPDLLNFCLRKKIFERKEVKK